MRGRLIRDLKFKGPSPIGGVILVMVAMVGMGIALNRFLFEVPDRPSVEALDKVSPPMGAEQVGEHRDGKPNGTSDGTPDGLVKQSTSEVLPASKSVLVQNNSGMEETPGAASSAAIAPSPGVLRVGNLTEHPLRVALLLKRMTPGMPPSATAPNAKSPYEPPAHWDFEPGEGSQKGLLLSLPNRKLKLKKGDILVAFAQDGSRRYWGPYVVGETSVPTWRPQSAEWELILEP